MAAVMMLECGKDEERKALSYLRLLKTSVTTAKYCQEHTVLSLASRMLERAASYEVELSQLTIVEGQRGLRFEIASARIDYLLARISFV